MIPTLHVLICQRVADLPDGPRAGPFSKDVCTACGAAVWVSDSSPRVGDIVCGPCLVVVVNDPKGGTFVVMPPTPEQAREIDEYERKNRGGK